MLNQEKVIFNVMGELCDYARYCFYCCEQIPKLSSKPACLSALCRGCCSSHQKAVMVGPSADFVPKVVWGWCQLERTPAAGRAGFLCPCSCWPKPLWVVLEQMLRSTHQWSQDPGCARVPVAWRVLWGLWDHPPSSHLRWPRAGPDRIKPWWPF